MLPNNTKSPVGCQHAQLATWRHFRCVDDNPLSLSLSSQFLNQYAYHQALTIVATQFEHNARTSNTKVGMWTTAASLGKNGRK